MAPNYIYLEAEELIVLHSFFFFFLFFFLFFFANKKKMLLYFLKMASREIIIILLMYCLIKLDIAVTSQIFPIVNSIKLDCILTPILFSVFLILKETTEKSDG